MQKDSTLGTIIVAGVLCIFCSVMVSTSAVSLKPLQEQNKKLDVKKNLLLSAGLLENKSASKEEIERAFSVVETKIVDLSTGQYNTEMNPDNYDQMSAASDPKLNTKIPSEKDYASIKKRERFSKVFFIKEGETVKQIILPMYGKGLWSTMYGFLVLSTDTTTVEGIGFYQHGETPGLGGEIENAQWQASWKGKRVYDESFNPILSVIKGSVTDNTANKEYKIDGLSGATLTCNGVTGMIKYWMGEEGFGPFLKKYRTKNTVSSL
ncbi:MAG: Na(+)-translocating NADH-quinone reductase subunit C [Bacteriovoracaceae bacterium]